MLNTCEKEFVCGQAIAFPTQTKVVVPLGCVLGGLDKQGTIVASTLLSLIRVRVKTCGVERA